ncbi:unnamed protein product [Acanthoscelides obtectus]|nr:unnamed protein product [Acanthoscelides obtectus]CAK1672630.1 Disks large-associated protein 1 [Acanthoscelides obtectus]
MGQTRDVQSEDLLQDGVRSSADAEQKCATSEKIQHRETKCSYNNNLLNGGIKQEQVEELHIVQEKEISHKKDLHIKNIHNFLFEPECNSLAKEPASGKPTFSRCVGEKKSYQSLQRSDSQMSRSVGRVVRKNSNKLLRRNSSRRSEVKMLQVKPSTGGDITSAKCPATDASDLSSSASAFDMDAMERSVDSIGTCSLDANASADLSNADWSDTTSVVTLRSVSLASPSASDYHNNHHLPSYLSLACTVSGYSPTTNYDPVRLARSRDASPLRIDCGGVGDLTSAHQRPTGPTYSVHNNLLSPPNLVPLPPTANTATTTSCLKGDKMENATTALAAHHHGEFYASKTVSFVSGKETRFSSAFSHDSVDSCIENGHHAIQRKMVSFESKNITSCNGQARCTSETALKQEYTNGNETKSFIQQRVERLYGPGALAQGFFVSKRQKSRLSESEESNHNNNESDRHSKSLTDKSFNEEGEEPVIKQSTSTPTLPVLRHLRPEFRAQLPIISPKKTEGHLQKSVTIPKLKDEVNMNGHDKSKKPDDIISCPEPTNGHVESYANEVVKDGHYFLKILNDQTSRLLVLADKIEKDILGCELPEEIVGKVRSATGKARLLVSQKMQQFRGLCTNNINQSVGEAFPTTNEDLQGFWDMVMLQVDQVDALFAEIYALRANNWKEPEKDKALKNGAVKTKKAVAVRPKTTAGNDETRKQREAQRKKMIEDRRKAMKAQKNATNGSIEIFVPESS